MPVFRKIAFLPSVRLSRTDLEDLARLLNSDADWVWFSTSDQDAEYSGGSIDELVSQGVPERLTNLRVIARGDDGRTARSIEMNIAWHLSTCFTQSSDEVWTKGKAQQIRDFFKRRSRWYDKSKKPVMFGGACLVGISIQLCIRYIATGQYNLSAVAGLLAVFFLLLSFPYPKGGLFPLVDIRMSDKPRSWWSVGTLLAALTFLATVATFVLAMMEYVE